VHEIQHSNEMTVILQELSDWNCRKINGTEKKFCKLLESIHSVTIKMRF